MINDKKLEVCKAFFSDAFNSFIYAPVSKYEASKNCFNGPSFSGILYEGHTVSAFTLVSLLQFQLMLSYCKTVFQVV
jgi:hypothetical protein